VAPPAHRSCRQELRLAPQHCPQRCVRQCQAPSVCALQASATAEGLGAAESLGAPLLGEHTAAPSEAPEGSCADVAEMEEGRPGQDATEREPTEQQQHQPIQQLLWTTPGEAVHLLETRGCAKLGSFRVQARPPGRLCACCVPAGRRLRHCRQAACTDRAKAWQRTSKFTELRRPLDGVRGGS